MKKLLVLCAFLAVILPNFALAQAGVPNPAAVYCQERGGNLQTDGSVSNCVFSDVTCEEWAFYRGECGNNHSLCEEKGYKIISKDINIDTWNAKFAVCIDKNGRECVEDDLKAGNCGKDDSISAGYDLNYKNFSDKDAEKSPAKDYTWYYIFGGVLIVMVFFFLFSNRKKQ